jgi:hypothetical protein
MGPNPFLSVVNVLQSLMVTYSVCKMPFQGPDIPPMIMYFILFFSVREARILNEWENKSRANNW